MNIWEAITGIIVLVIGLVLFWQSYNNVAQCNSLAGQVWTAVSSVFGGSGAQACYNASLTEVASLIAAIIGAVIIYAAVKNNKFGRSRSKK